MQLWITLVSVLITASEARYFYPYSTYPYQPSHPVATTTPRPHLQANINDVTVVDEKTGIHYNPYSKHHPGRHVCTHQRNVSYPIRTKRVFAKPTYKKYMVRCGTQWCEGVRLVYEKYHRDVVTTNNHTLVNYTCCPGWTKVDYKSHGCNKPVCYHPCMNGGTCIRPNTCLCPPGYDGSYCEAKTSLYLPTDCSLPCKNGGVCKPKTICICPPGYTGKLCEKDIDECKLKPCDQKCYNTPGSFKCECKESFILQKDGQTCRRENEYDGALEAKDLEQQQKFDKLDKRLMKLEKMMREKSRNEVTKQDLDSIYNNIDKISDDIGIIACKLRRLESFSSDIDDLKSRIDTVDKRTLNCNKPSRSRSRSQTPSRARSDCTCDSGDHPPGCSCQYTTL